MIVTVPVGAVILAVTTLPKIASPVTLAFAPYKNPFAVTLPFDVILPVVELTSPATNKPADEKVATFAVPLIVISTLALLYTLTLLVPFASAPTIFAAVTLPAKFAVLPLSSKLTVKFETITLPLKLAVLPANSKLTVKLFVSVLLDTLTKLAVAKLPKLALLTVKLPFAVTAFEVLLNVKPADEFAVPLSLNTTPVLAPGIVIFPEILPITLPMKFGAVTLPVTPN